MARNKARSKKGISLAFVIVVVLALMVFSAMLFSAASHSLSMTGDSTDGRQTYLTAKSAIEYAKTVAFRSAKAGELTPFSVGPDGDGYKQLESEAPDGTKTYAQCTNPSGDGKTWKILAKVKYNGADKYRQLAYSFTLTKNAAPVNLPSDFLAAGFEYGTHALLKNAENDPFFYDVLSDNQGISVYPLIIRNAVHPNQATTGYIKAPEIFFLGSSNSLGRQSSIYCYNNQTCFIYSNMITFANNISGQYYDNQPCKIILYPEDGSAATGTVYFMGKADGVCSVILTGGKNSTTRIPVGYYRFEAGIDLCSLTEESDGIFRDASGKTLTKLTTEEQNDSSLASFQQDLAFVQNCYSNETGVIYSGEPDGYPYNGITYYGTNFELNGAFGASVSTTLNLSSNDGDGHWNLFHVQNLEEKTVFTYANRTDWNTDPWPLYLNGNGTGSAVGISDGNYLNDPKYAIFPAKQFFLRFVGSNDFTLPSAYNVVFHSDLVSLSMAKTDTDAGTGAEDRPKIVQAAGAPDSQFLLTSLTTDASGSYQNLMLVVQNDIQVLYDNNPKSYVIPSGVYSVKSGFNFFDKSVTDWDAFWSGCRKGDYPASGSGGSGSSSGGSFTITPGQYTNS